MHPRSERSSEHEQGAGNGRARNGSRGAGGVRRRGCVCWMRLFYVRVEARGTDWAGVRCFRLVRLIAFIECFLCLLKSVTSYIKNFVCVSNSN